MIVITTLVVIGYGCEQFDNGVYKPPAKWIDQYTAAIGFSAYAFEGIGLILPVQDIVEKKESYKTIVYTVICSCCTLYVSFGCFCVMAW